MLVKRDQLPSTALLTRYSHAHDGPNAYTDCYVTQVDGHVALESFVYAFYTSWLFKLERLLLDYFAKIPSTDAQARAVAGGSGNEFAAWTVEDRADDQLLMCDLRGTTRSWFMVDQVDAGEAAMTVLYFGSAVVPQSAAATGERKISHGFRLLLPFHKLYSRALLSLAKSCRKRTENN